MRIYLIVSNSFPVSLGRDGSFYVVLAHVYGISKMVVTQQQRGFILFPLSLFGRAAWTDAQRSNAPRRKYLTLVSADMQTPIFTLLAEG